jgi:hypothetical protein
MLLCLIRSSSFMIIFYYLTYIHIMNINTYRCIRVEIILIIILMWFIIICVLRLLKAIMIWLIVSPSPHIQHHKQPEMIKKVFTFGKSVLAIAMIDND